MTGPQRLEGGSAVFPVDAAHNREMTVVVSRRDLASKRLHVVDGVLGVRTRDVACAGIDVGDQELFLAALIPSLPFSVPSGRERTREASGGPRLELSSPEAGGHARTRRPPRAALVETFSIDRGRSHTAFSRGSYAREIVAS